MKFLNTITRGTLLVMLLLLLGNTAWAQRTVKGKVTDAENGEGLVGASVTVVGTTRGAITDLDGNYSVDVPDGSLQLRFAYTGYTEQVIDLGDANTVDVAMQAGNALEEIVVVGYGTVKQKEVTSAVATVKADDFNQGNITSPAQLIQGKVAGVSISLPGSDPNGEFSIRLRGLSSLSSGTEPLVVVDGIPGVSLNLVDPNDIASIDVLKDGSAAAIYGTRASAGVIIITTKKGTSGRTVADYNGSIAFNNVARRYDVLSASDFVSLAGGTDLTPADGVGGTDTDWFDQITQQGTSNIQNLSLSGGMGNGSYRASFNYRDVEGILRTSGFEQYNGSLAFNQKVLNERLTFTGNMLLTTRDADFSFPEIFRYAIVANPTAPITSTDAQFSRYGGYAEYDLFDYFNPVAILEQNTNSGRINRLLGNLRADLEIIEGLNAGITVAQERFNGRFGEFYSKQSKFRGIGRNGLGVQNTREFINNLLEATATYALDFGGDNSITLLGGYSWQEFEYAGNSIEAGNVLTNEFANNNLGAFQDIAQGQATISSYRGENTLVAFFGRVTANIGDTYFASAGVRREGSTRFGPENRWGTFPFVSAGVNIEKLVDISNVDQLKVRAGYGVTGNQPNQNSLYRQTYVPGASFFYNGAYVPSYGPNRNPNPNLKWEEKGEFNVGLDFALADYKFTGSLDYYNRLTEDLILALTVPVPPNLTGTTFQNVAAIRNTGFEATINANNLVNTPNFKWTPGIVFTTYKSTLEDFGRKDTLRYANVGAPGQNDVRYTLVYSGALLGQLYGPVRESVNDDGTVTYKDINGDGVVNPESLTDQQVIGNGTPDFELGFNSDFTFGNFDLNFFLRGVFGHSLANEYRVFYENLDPQATTWNKVRTDFFDENLKAKSRFDDTHVEDATFLRLDNATLGYNFKLRSGSWFNRARLYLNGQNLFTITNYSGVDPEPRVGDPGSVDNGGRLGTALDPLAPGIDRRSTYFLARTFSFGVNLGF